MSIDNNENLDKKVDDCRRKLLECPSMLIDSRRQMLDDLSNALYHCFQQLGGIEYLDESITLRRQSLNLCPIGDPNRSVILNNFAAAMTDRFKQLGRTEDLEEAIACCRQALALQPICSSSQQPCHCHVDSLPAVGKNGGSGGGDHMSPSSTCSLP